jgi:hypothetical protein
MAVLCCVFRVSCTVRARALRSGFFCLPLSYSCVCMCVRAECAGLLRFDVFTLSSVSDPYSLWRMRNDGESTTVTSFNKYKTMKGKRVYIQEKTTSRYLMCFSTFTSSPSTILLFLSVFSSSFIVLLGCIRFILFYFI